MPVIPEQKMKPLATIAWLYGPSAAGASSLDTARLVIEQVSSITRHRATTRRSLEIWVEDLDSLSGPAAGKADPVT
jgi:ribose 1,5-bisphosphokinase PhnN